MVGRRGIVAAKARVPIGAGRSEIPRSARNDNRLAGVYFSLLRRPLCRRFGRLHRDASRSGTYIPTKIVVTYAPPAETNLSVALASMARRRIAKEENCQHQYGENSRPSSHRDFERAPLFDSLTLNPSGAGRSRNLSRYSAVSASVNSPVRLVHSDVCRRT